MSEQVSAECRRQGAWGLVGEGTGAKLFCADTRRVLSKEHIFGALHCNTYKIEVKINIYLDSVDQLSYQTDISIINEPQASTH